MPAWLLPVLLALAGTGAGGLGIALADEPATAEAQRHYGQASEALARRDFGTFRVHLDALESHPLRVVLESKFLSARLADTDPRVIEGFVERNRHAAVSRQLELRWLYHLGRTGQWQALLRHYEDGDGDVELTCLALSARLATGATVHDLDESIEDVWLSGASRPDACDSLFAAWGRAGLLTPARTWARIELVMDRGLAGLARWLARTWLPAGERSRVDSWIAVHESPRRELMRLAPVTDRLGREMVLDGIIQLARTDPRVAWTLWPAVVERHDLPPAVAAGGKREVALRAAWDHLPEAAQWLAEPDIDGADEQVREWRIRASLRSGDWGAVLEHIAALPPGEQENPRWRYWQARALEQTSRSEAAGAIYLELAGIRQYHGFLAADRLGRGYAMQHRSLTADEAELARLREMPAFRLATALRGVGEGNLARRQWSWALRDLDEPQLRNAAVLASTLFWDDRAIVTVARTRHNDDLALRFPLVHLDAVQERSVAAGLDAAWVLGLIRQESAFIPDAVSRVGARGLMQLMPDTARHLAAQRGLPYRGPHDLERPELNIGFGTAYLGGLAAEYGGNQAMASAAYNAGPHRVRAWLPRAGHMDADIWVETIPYRETRDFVKNVLSFAAVYDYRLGATPISLAARMPPVPAAST